MVFTKTRSGRTSRSARTPARSPRHAVVASSTHPEGLSRRLRRTKRSPTKTAAPTARSSSARGPSCGSSTCTDDPEPTMPVTESKSTRSDPYSSAPGCITRIVCGVGVIGASLTRGRIGIGSSDRDSSEEQRDQCPSARVHCERLSIAADGDRALRRARHGEGRPRVGERRHRGRTREPHVRHRGTPRRERPRRA